MRTNYVSQVVVNHNFIDFYTFLYLLILIFFLVTILEPVLQQIVSIYLEKINKNYDKM